MDKPFPCPRCGARLDYDPAAAGLKCPYCGHQQAVARGVGEVRELDLDRHLAETKEKKVRVAGRSSEVRCGPCGAVVLIEDHVATEKCPYCGNHLENPPHPAEAMIPPEGVVPFAVGRRGAVEAFEKWLRALWFAPDELKKIATTSQWSGVYLPFWTFDARTRTRYRGERGDHYVDTESYTDTETYTDSNGQIRTRPVTRTRTVTRVRWTHVSGEIDYDFDDVLIPASTSVPPRCLETFDAELLRRVLPFQPDYLAGFVTERYTHGPRDGFKAAREQMDGIVQQLVRQAIGGDVQRLGSAQTQYRDVTFKQVLLPLWLATYHYRGRSYRVMVNGVTGTVVGDRPYSTAKIISLVFGILLTVLAVVALVLWLTR